jgi:hypothetical protein
MKGNVAILKCSPIRWRASHVCTGARKSVVSILLPIFKQLTGKHYRMRLIVQLGSDSAMVSGFQKYGLLRNNLSYAVGGLLRNDDFTEWLRTRQEFELQRGENTQDAAAVDGVDRDERESDGQQIQPMVAAGRS